MEKVHLLKGGIRMKKGLFGVILAVAIALVPSVVNAEEVTLQSKISAANNGDTIVLDQDYAEDITIDAGKEITIDLNGHNLESATGHTITNRGMLTIKGNGNITNNKIDGAPLFNDKGTVYIYGGNFSRINATNNSYYVILNHGVMSIDGGSFSSENGIASLIDNGWYNPAENTDQNTAVMYIYGGTFKMKNNDKYIKNDDYGQMYVYGGNFSMEGPSSAVIANVGSVGNVETVEVNGGNFEYTGSKQVIWDYIYQTTNHASKTVSIYGGTFKTTDTNAVISNAPLGTDIESTTDSNGNTVLEFKRADYTKIGELFDKVQQIDDSKYTEESLNKLLQVLDSVNWNLGVSEQELVNQMADHIENAINALVEKESTSTPEANENIENPNTLDNLLFYIITLIVSVVCLGGSTLYLKRHSQ